MNVLILMTALAAASPMGELRQAAETPDKTYDNAAPRPAVVVEDVKPKPVAARMRRSRGGRRVPVKPIEKGSFQDTVITQAAPPCGGFWSCLGRGAVNAVTAPFVVANAAGKAAYGSVSNPTGAGFLAVLGALGGLAVGAMLVAPTLIGGIVRAFASLF